MPKLKTSKERRERVITAEERVKVLDYLLAPAREREPRTTARDRRRVGLQLQFLLLMHGEMDNIRKAHVSPKTNTVKIVATKTAHIRILRGISSFHDRRWRYSWSSRHLAKRITFSPDQAIPYRIFTRFCA